MTITYRVHPVWLITAALLLGGAVWAHHKRRVVNVTKVEYIRDPQDEIYRLKAAQFDRMHNAVAATRTPATSGTISVPPARVITMPQEKQS